jgi:thioredoxin 1
MLRKLARPAARARPLAQLAQRGGFGVAPATRFAHSVPYAETSEDFLKTLQGAGEKLVCVDFTATWCGPCKQISPIFEMLAEKHKDTVVCVKVDVDENSETAADCGIQAMPTFQFYKNTKKVAEFAGADPDKLQALMDEHS